MDKQVHRAVDRLAMEEDAVSQVATEWFLELKSNETSGERVGEWQQWLAADQKHALAFERVESFWKQASPVSKVRWPSDSEVATDNYRGEESVSHWLNRTSPQRPAFSPRTLKPRWALAAGLCALALALGWMTSTWIGSRPDIAVQTAVGEMRTFTLPDGSTLSLGGRTQIEARLSKTARLITLREGEAFFDVAKDPARPFIVSAGGTSVTAIGTAFNVRRTNERVVVAVSEGVVQVTESHAPARVLRPNQAQTSGKEPQTVTTRLIAGQQLSLGNSGAPSKPLPIDTQSVAGWREGRLQYMNEPLETVVHDLARYSAREIRISDPQLRNLRVTGIVFQENIDGWLTSLEATFPLQVLRNPDGSMAVQSRHAE